MHLHTYNNDARKAINITLYAAAYRKLRQIRYLRIAEASVVCR